MPETNHFEQLSEKDKDATKHLQYFVIGNLQKIVFKTRITSRQMVFIDLRIMTNLWLKEVEEFSGAFHQKSNCPRHKKNIIPINFQISSLIIWVCHDQKNPYDHLQMREYVSIAPISWNCVVEDQFLKAGVNRIQFGFQGVNISKLLKWDQHK